MMDQGDIAVLVLTSVLVFFWACAIVIGIVDICNDVHRSQERNEVV